MKSRKTAGISEQTSRRAFTKTVAGALMAAPLAASLAQAQTPTNKPKETIAPPNPQPTPAQGAAPQKPSPLAEAYAEVARVRFGDHVTPEQLEEIKKDLEGNVRTADRLRKVKLQNADEPDFTFSAT